MNDAGVAKRYAQALFMLAEESQNVDKIEKDFDYACETIFGNAELEDAFTGVQYSMRGKKNAIVEIFKKDIDQSVLNFLLLLIEKGRSGYLADIHMAFKALIDEKNGIADATVTSAYALSEEDTNKIAKALEKRVGKTIRLKVVVDPSLIAGVRLQYGDKIIDGSVEARLESMRKRLMTQDIVGGESPQ